MIVPVFHVDAFANRPFSGNPAVVCLLDEPADAEWMRRVAAEMNLSETAFVAPGADAHSLRWFTPSAEVDLCGHGTLAAAHVLWETGRIGVGDTARFDTRSGRLTAERRGDWIALDFPALAVAPGPIPEEAIAALDVQPVATGTSGAKWIVEAANEDAVRALRPDFHRLRALAGRALMVTARGAAASGADFVSRYFAPWVGVEEDPVTGSAHCALGPYWAARLGRRELVAFQASPRGGWVRVSCDGDRVRLAGQATTVVAGRWTA